MSFAGRLRSSVCAPHQRVSWSALVGYDLFISYRRSDATPYAAALFEALRQADFRCFLDDNDATPGKPLTDKLRWALKRSKVLLIVASPDLPLSTWVPKEVKMFAMSQRDIILINVKDGMTTALASSTLGPLLNQDALWIDEQPGIGPGDAPSAHVIGSVQKNFNHRRANRNLRLIAGVVTIAIAGFAALAAWQWRTALARLDVVQSQALAADARRLASQEPFLALKTAIEAFATSDSPDAETALLEGLSRVPSLKRFLPCREGQKAVGVAFSDAGSGLLGYACLSYRQGAPETTLRVVDLDGVQKYAATVAGDARSFSFADGLHLRIGMSGRTTSLDLQTSQFQVSSSLQAPPSQIGNPSEVQGRLDEVAADCIRQHSYSIRYFTSAASADNRLIAYTTEANQVVIADVTKGFCAGRPLEAHTHNVLAIAWSPTGRYLASAGAIADGDNGHGVALWDREQLSSFARVVHELNHFGVADPKFALSADGSSWICGTCDDRIIWDGQPVDFPTGVDSGPASAVAMNPDGKEAAVALPGGIVVIRRNGSGFSVELRQGPSALVQALTYVNGTLYAEDEKLNGWKVSGDTATKTIIAAPFDSISCFDDGPAGPYFTSEVFDHTGAAHLALTDLISGVVKEFPVPSDANTCAALTFSPGAMTAVRTTANYGPFLVVRMSSGSEVQRMSNPLRQSAGLQTVLRNVRLSRDGRRLVASSDDSGLAVFNLAAERLIGAIDLGEVRHVALAAGGKAALVEGGGKILLVNLDSVSWQRKARQLISG
jgi:WD40 repeat protein